MVGFDLPRHIFGGFEKIVSHIYILDPTIQSQLEATSFGYGLLVIVTVFVTSTMSFAHGVVEAWVISHCVL